MCYHINTKAPSVGETVNDVISSHYVIKGVRYLIIETLLLYVGLHILKDLPESDHGIIRTLVSRHALNWCPRPWDIKHAFCSTN